MTAEGWFLFPSPLIYLLVIGRGRRVESPGRADITVAMRTGREEVTERRIEGEVTRTFTVIDSEGGRGRW